MYKFKNKINDIWNMVKKNKRFKYLSLISILMLFCLALNVTFARYTTSKNNKGADITIGDLKYKMVINEKNYSSSVGTKATTNTIIGDRIILLKAGKTEEFDVALTSLNTIDTKYEITYKVCTDKNCTKFVETPSEINILYEKGKQVYGIIEANKSNSVTLRTINSSANNYYVQVNLNVGYIHNNLSLVGQIKSSFIKDGDYKLIAYVDGKEVIEFPKTDNYNVYATCNSNSGDASNVVANVYWSGSEWLLNLASLNIADIECSIFFSKKANSEINAPNGWYQREVGTLIAAIRKNYVSATATGTTPGVLASESGEKVLASAPDDYGTSFYFRGAVTNNYVQFANKCWRIVRITGDGSIKLVLHNDNVNNANNPCASSNNSTTAAFARYSGTTYTTTFNDNRDDNTYVGFMYGEAGASTYAKAQNNGNESTILMNLKTWYDKTFSDTNKNKLADTIWCNDKSTVKDANFNPWNLGTIGAAYGIGKNINYYAAVQRVVSANEGAGGTGPILTCPNDNDGGKLSKFTASDTINGNGKLNGYKIGLLTMDEVVFAGAARAITNNTYYLYENTGNTKWWTLSPGYFYSHDYKAYILLINDQSYIDSNWDTNTHALRPSVSLVSNITISGGTGTSSAPYVIN